MTLLVVLLLFGFIGICTSVIVSYNQIIRLKSKVKNSWSNIDVHLQRRFDLIPNLVQTIEACAEHERQIIEKVTAIRQLFLDAMSNQDKLKANQELTLQLSTIYAMIGHYPQLKTDVNFRQLQTALTEVEEDISYARQFYNDAVTIYNNKLLSFPNNIIASMFNFQEETLFDATAGAEIAPTIQFKRHSKYSNCPNCGATVPEDTANCKFCGTSLV